MAILISETGFGCSWNTCCFSTCIQRHDVMCFLLFKIIMQKDLSNSESCIDFSKAYDGFYDHLTLVFPQHFQVSIISFGFPDFLIFFWGFIWCSILLVVSYFYIVIGFCLSFSIALRFGSDFWKVLSLSLWLSLDAIFSSSLSTKVSKVPRI